MEKISPGSIGFVNVWKEENPALQTKVREVWKRLTDLQDSELDVRQNQLVFVAMTDDGEVIGVTTAFKAYIKQLKNFFYVFRCLVVPGYNLPGLDSKLTVLTRDLLESQHHNDSPDTPIGLITLIHNPQLKERNLAVWPSGFVYIGNSKEGKHIRVYYFKDARITP